MTSARRRVALTASIVLVGLVSVAKVSSAERARLEIASATGVAGDGRAVIEVVVSIAPAAEVTNVSDLQLEASAGTLEGPQPRGASAVVYRFRAPRVAGPIRVSLEATAKHGRRALRAKRMIEVSEHVSTIGEQRSGGALDLRGPEHLVLARHERATISLATAKKPRLLTNTGTLSKVTRAADGRWHATYTPTASFVPRIAIIAAITDGDRLDWIAIPLHGRGKLNVTSERGARIELEVGEARFGPLRATTRGTAAIPITVPPGILAATSIATDELGNEKRASLPLDPPPFNRVLVVCPSSFGPVRVLVVDGAGKPANDAALAASANIGTLSPFTRQRPGVFATTHTTTATGGKGNRLEVELRLTSEAASRSRCSGDIPRNLPIGLTVEVAGQRLSAGGEPVELTILARYPERGLPQSWPVALSADVGSVSEAKEIAPGRYRATYTPPEKLGGKNSATVTATFNDLEVAAASADVGLEPGPAANLRPSAAAGLRADGVTTGVSRVIVSDRFGNPTAISGLALTVAGASFPLEEVSRGRYQGRFVVPRSSRSGSIRGRVTAGELSAPISIAFRGARSRLAASIRGGYLTNFNRVSGATASVALDVHLPIAGGERFALGGDIGLGVSDRRESDVEPLEIGVRTITSLVRGSVWAPVGSFWLYGGATAGLANSRTAVESPSSGRLVSWERAIAAGGFGGAELALGAGQLMLEVGYVHARVGGAAVEGNVLGLTATTGYRLGLF